MTKAKKERQMIFTSKIVDEATNKINDGIVIKRYENPWLKGEVGIRRAGVTFKITPEEQEEYIKCALDINHFTEKYCKVKTDDGSIGNIKLRDYQEDILNNFTNNRFNILMASRQVGKCFELITSVLRLDTSSNTLTKVPLYKLYFSHKKKLSFYDKLKYFIYKIIHMIN